MTKEKTYIETRNDYIYYKIIKKILFIISKNQNSIIDIGSNGIDLLSDININKKISLCLDNPINNDKVQGIKCNFFDYKNEKLFDIVTSFQVIEHVEEAEKFTQKLLNTGKILLISLPYNWKKGACKWHCQDPIDENKIFNWTHKKPTLSWFCYDKDHCRRIICLYYPKIPITKYLKLMKIPKYSSYYKNKNLIYKIKLLLNILT